MYIHLIKLDIRILLITKIENKTLYQLRRLLPECGSQQRQHHCLNRNASHPSCPNYHQKQLKKYFFRSFKGLG